MFATMTRLMWMGSLLIAVPAFGADKTRDRDQTQLQIQDEEPDQTRDRILLQLHDRLRDELKLDDGTLAALGDGLQQYLTLGGDEQHIRATIRTGWELGCKGECLREMVQSANRAMIAGMQDGPACSMIRDTLREQVRERDQQHASWTDTELGDRLHDRIREQLRDFDRERQRLMEQEMRRDWERDQQRDMQRDHQRVGQGGPTP